jgi:chromate transport protein ChrA
MLLPGPEAQQLATYIGWLMHRTRRFDGGRTVGFAWRHRVDGS